MIFLYALWIIIYKKEYRNWSRINANNTSNVIFLTRTLDIKIVVWMEEKRPWQDFSSTRRGCPVEEATSRRPVRTSHDFRVHKVEQRRVDNFSVALVTSYIHIQTPFTSWSHRVTAPHYRYFSRYSWINAKFVFTYFQHPLFQKSCKDRVKSIKNVGDTRCDIRSNDFQIIL